MEPPPQDLREPLGWFAYVRGVLLGLHLLAVTLLALPSVGEGMYRSAWKDPTVQGEFSWWAECFNNCGISLTPAQLENGLWESASAYESMRSKALKPFGPYYTYCGTFQAWRMFAGPHRYPSRLLIDIEENGTWRPIYVKSDPQHAWLSEQLDHYRMRPFIYRLSWYHYTKDDPQFDELAEWIARRAAQDFPSARRVGVSLFAARTRSPDEVLAGAPVSGEFVPDVVRNLGDRR